MRRLPLVVLLIAAGAVSLWADEIRVLSVGSLQRGLAPIAEKYNAQTGHEVTIEFGTTPVVTARLEELGDGGERFDVVIATREVLEAAAAREQVDLTTTRVVGRVGIGMGVRAGVEVPEIRTVDDLKAFLLAADSVVYNRGSSGVKSQSMIESLGITRQIAEGTTQYANGGQVITHVLEGEGIDIGLAPLTEIRFNAPRGLGLVALPDAVQNYTSYNAAVTTAAVDAAADFLRHLSTPEVRAALAATGVD